LQYFAIAEAESFRNLKPDVSKTLDKRSKKSLPKKRKAAAWNSGYVVDLLNLRPLQDI